jgi:hypothetical protein
MDKNKALQNLLQGKASKEEIEFLKQAIASGEISIGGDMNRSVVIIGSGNKVELPPEALGILKAETKTEEAAKGEPPYMGLRYFDTSDANLFFGRETLTSELLARIQNESFLAIVGASGSGKSSVARAGLIPSWKKENERSTIRVITPTTHPLESLAASLTREAESVTATSVLMDDLMRDARSLRLYVKKKFGEAKFLLLIDQFEETFTLCKDLAERKAFIENLLSLADDAGVARVVITLRADFYHHCAEYESLRVILEKHQAYIGAMSSEELRQAITLPAKKNGWDFQSGLVDLILSDVGSEPGALPLLSHALLETWKRRQKHTLTLHGYHESGGVKKSIAQTAENVYFHLTPVEQTIARGIFLRLTRLDERDERHDTRGRVLISDLMTSGLDADSVSILLDKLASVRLIVKTVSENKTEIEVAHEALIHHWERLRNWSDDNRRFLIWRQKINDRYLDWQKNEGELLQGSYLLEAENWLLEQGDLLSTGEKKYIEESIAYQTRRQKLLSNMNRGVLIPFALLAILVGIIGSYVVTLQTSTTMRERLANQLLESGRVVSDSFVQQEITHTMNARSIAFLSGIGEALKGNDEELIISLIKPVMAGFGIENVILIAQDGKEIVQLRNEKDGSITVVNLDSGMASSPIVTPYLISRNIEGEPRRDISTNFSDDKLYYYTALPVSLNKEFVGVVLVGTSLETILPFFKSRALADIVIYEENGQTAGTTFGTQDPATYQKISISEKSYQEIISSKDLVVGNNLELDNRSFSFAYAPLQVGNDRIGVFAVALPLDFVVQTGQNNRTTYVLFFAVVFLLVLFIGIAVWRLIINPLHALESGKRINPTVSKRSKRDWLFFVFIVPSGIFLMLIAGQAAIYIAPDWALNTNMLSGLNPEYKFTKIGEIQPILPAILTPFSWADTYLTPNSDATKGNSKSSTPEVKSSMTSSPIGDSINITETPSIVPAGTSP